MFFKRKSNAEDTQEVVKEFALSIKDRIMSKINVQISDMKEVLRSAVAQIIVEELNTANISGIDASPDGQRRLHELRRRITSKTDAVIVQQTVAAMDRISRAEVVPANSKKTSKK